MNKYLHIIPCLLSLAACGGIKKDYVISDMSSDSRPDWLDSENVTDLNSEGDGYRYFFGENDNIASESTKALCRAAAETKARHDLTAEIETAIKGSYAETESASGEDVKSAAELSRSMIVEKAVSGAEKYKEYWEQRSHKKDLGAAKDYKSWSCNVLVRMKSDAYDEAVKAAGDK